MERFSVRPRHIRESPLAQRSLLGSVGRPRALELRAASDVQHHRALATCDLANADCQRDPPAADMAKKRVSRVDEGRRAPPPRRHEVVELTGHRRSICQLRPLAAGLDHIPPQTAGLSQTAVSRCRGAAVAPRDRPHRGRRPRWAKGRAGRPARGVGCARRRGRHLRRGPAHRLEPRRQRPADAAGRARRGRRRGLRQERSALGGALRTARPAWIYSFLEAEVLHDSGSAARLRRLAQSAYDGYETSAELRNELAALLGHGAPKLRRAVEAGGEQAGYCAALFLPAILDGLYAVHQRPQPAGSRRLDPLHTLPLSGEERHHVRVSCTGSPEQRVSAIAALHEMLTRQLGP